jgi:hypothetical protein
MKMYGGVETKLQHSQLHHQIMASFQLEVKTGEALYYRAEFQDPKVQSTKLTGHCRRDQEINKLTRTQQFVLPPLQNSSRSLAAILEIGLIYRT